LFTTDLYDDKSISFLYIIMFKYDRKDIYNEFLEYNGTKLYNIVSKQSFITDYEILSKLNVI